MSATYAVAREELRTAELELMQQRERVAEMRRCMPIGPASPNYEFTEFVNGEERSITLTDLFSDPSKPLVIYHFMYGEQQSSPCPMCAMWADGWNSIADHLAERINFVVAASSSAQDWHDTATARGWTNFRAVSAAPSSFKVDIGGEDDAGNQWPFLSVWELNDGAPTMTYSGGANIEGDHWRGIDLLSPIWHLLDLTPEGRGNFMPT